MIRQRKIELLAPAKNLECGIAAIDHGADAVYIGAPRFGARAAAGNSLEDIAELVKYAHLYNVRIYVTINTILKVKDLTLLSESEDSGVYMVMAGNGREFFITGHSEYAPNTLDGEYKRDLGKGLPIEMPRNYYRNDHPDDGVLVRWRGHANLMFSNWLNYYVYQETPFDINEIK